MKKNLVKTVLVAVLAVGLGTTATFAAVSAATPAALIAETGSSSALADTDGYTLEEMLVYALQDEYAARAEYAAIIAEYGEVKPFTNILAAENVHIDRLLALFATYGFTVPADEAASSVVLPDSLSSAYSTGVAAEQANIAMYEAFLATEGLPEDVASAFTALRNASVQHQKAFSRDRLAGVCTQALNQVKSKVQNGWNKMFQNGIQGGSQNRSQSQGGSFNGTGTCR